MKNDDIHVYEQANKGAVWFIVGSVGVFGLFFFVGGAVQLLNRISADAAGVAALGLALLIFAERLWRFFRLPRMTVGSDALVVRRFWGRTVTWPYSGVVRWSTETQLIERDAFRRPLLIPRTVERLVRIDPAGDRHVLVLPGFASQNERLLNALAERSGRPITAS